MGRHEFYTSTNMKTSRLMLWITRLIRSTVNAVIMYSCFCVFKGLLEMRKRGFYGGTLVKIDTIGLGVLM